jgi:hypothetical protein
MAILFGHLHNESKKQVTVNVDSQMPDLTNESGEISGSLNVILLN